MKTINTTHGINEIARPASHPLPSRRVWQRRTRKTTRATRKVTSPPNLLHHTTVSLTVNPDSTPYKFTQRARMHHALPPHTTPCVLSPI
ncbi:jg1434 [Pararge aegeria aegeria]|uniref:Jg1434 protein n=2 Tax=Pararge aegeria TaxID=116150 RepID=A0A8S4R069_9NEOP|nr:jg1434 [Pararge aegeria aegeria]